jgi:NAD(P)-dependent dehydrogenase (short-subunit alcohol dehydrogenase family)
VTAASGQKSPRDSVVVVTGASAGVGRATVRAFARRGASIALLARGPDGLRATREEVEREGGRALDLVTDVADPEQVEAAAIRIEEELGPIDIWINNAMVSVLMPLAEMTSEDFRRVTEVTYLGCVHGTMSALKRMVPRDRGSIVQVGSALAYRGIPLQSAYCGAKHAMQGFTESVRCELLHERLNVQISMVQLPALNTPQFHWVKTNFDKHPQPVPPIYQPELAAEAIVWAASHRRREVNVGEATAATVVANKIVPGLLDRYLGRTGFDSQQTDWPIETDRADNLWEPVAGDHGARGVFNEKAHERSLQWWLTTRRRWALLGAGVLAFLGTLRRGKY